MFEASLESTPNGYGRRAGAMSLAIGAHLLVVLPLGAISLLVVDEIVVPKNRADQIIFQVNFAAPTVPAPPQREAAGPAGPSSGPPRLGSPSGGPRRQMPAAPEAPPVGLHDLGEELDLESPDPLGSGDGPGAGDGDGPAGSPFGIPDGFGDDIEGVEDGPGSGAPIPVTTGVEPPKLIHKVLPDYPRAARVAKIEGKVCVKAVISPTGEVVDVEIVSSRSPLLNDAALDAVRRWKYRPARRNGEPVSVYFTVLVDFILE
jgi:protein TonB